VRVITWRGRLNPVQTHPGEISNSTDSRLILAVVTRVPGSQVWELEATGSGGFCEELQRLGRRMRQGLGLLSREPEAPADGPGGGEVEDEGEDLHLGTAEGAEQRVDLSRRGEQARPN